MPLTHTKAFKALLGPVLLLTCWVVLYNSFRVTALVLLLVLIGAYVHFVRTSKTGLMRLVFVGFLIAAFLPIDVTVHNAPGPPRFVPLIMGMPHPEDFAAADRGEAVLGGCIVRGNEPRWMLVW